MQNLLGKNIKSYRIEGLVGEGGMGSVFVGYDPATKKKVAIKVLYYSTYQANPEKDKRFRLEASILEKLDHPNIVQVLDFVEDETGRYLIMEFVEGKLIEELFRYRTPEEKLDYTRGIFLQLLDGVEYAHQKGVIHRDLKPSNILITRDKTVKLLDFGVAKIREEDHPHLTKTGASVGTTYYMSPEQVRGQKVDTPTDIYSLGVLLYEMLTGENPYVNLGLSNYEINQKIVKESLPKISLEDKNISDRLNHVVSKATEKNAAHRYKSIHEFKVAFLKALGEQTEDISARKGSRKRRIAVAAGITLCLAVPGIIYLATRSSAEEQSQYSYQAYQPEHLAMVDHILLRKALPTVIATSDSQDTDRESDDFIVDIPTPVNNSENMSPLPFDKIKASASVRMDENRKFVVYKLENLSGVSIKPVYLKLRYWDEYGYLKDEIMRSTLDPGEVKSGVVDNIDQQTTRVDILVLRNNPQKKARIVN